MGVTLAVTDDLLRRAKADWDASADELDGSWRRLSRASTDGFSPDVAAAVEAFRDPWVGELKARAAEAQDYSDAIVLFRNPLWATDAEIGGLLGAPGLWAGHGGPAGDGERP